MILIGAASRPVSPVALSSSLPPLRAGRAISPDCTELDPAGSWAVLLPPGMCWVARHRLGQFGQHQAEDVAGEPAELMQVRASSARHLERRAERPTLVAQRRERYMKQSVHFGKIHRSAEAGLVRPAEHGVDQEATVGHGDWAQYAEDVDRHQVQAHLVGSLTDGGGGWTLVFWLGSSAGEDQLTGVVVEIVGAFGKEDLQTLRVRL